MAKELKLFGANTSLTYHALLFNEALQVWNGTAYVTYVSGDYATYDIALTQLGATGNFYADLPTGAKAGGTIIVDYRQEATPSTPAESDGNVGSEVIYWDSAGDVRVTGRVNLNLAQAVPTSNTAETVGDSLNASRADAFGKVVISGTNMSLYAANNSTVVKSFTMNSATNPTTRTP